MAVLISALDANSFTASTPFDIHQHTIEKLGLVDGVLRVYSLGRNSVYVQVKNSLHIDELKDKVRTVLEGA
jgi:hypothetical protein